MLFSNLSFASSKMGVEWFSISKESEIEYTVQVAHVFLGAGSREAFFFVKVCNDGVSAFQLGDKGFTQFTVKCFKGIVEHPERIVGDLYYKKNFEFTHFETVKPVSMGVCSVSEYNYKGIASLIISGVSICSVNSIKIFEIKNNKLNLIQDVEIPLVTGDYFSFEFNYRSLGYDSIVIEYNGVKYLYNKKEYGERYN